MSTLPPGASMERTLEAVKVVEHHYLEDEKANVNGLFSVTGFSFSGRGQNTALVFRRWSGGGGRSVALDERRARVDAEVARLKELGATEVVASSKDTNYDRIPAMPERER